MRLYPMFEDEGQGGGTATFEVNGQQMTAEQVVEAYKKLQGDHTKVTQKNSELGKQVDQVKPWLDWDSSLDALAEKTGLNVRAIIGKNLDGLVESLAAGKAPSDAQLGQLDKAITKAEDKGDDKTLKQLESLQSIVMEQEFEKNLATIEKEANDDDVPFDRTEFLAFADEWLADMGIGDEDEFDLKLLKKAYQAYEAKQLKEQKNRPNIPKLGTSGGAGGPNNSGKKEPIGGIKGAAAKARQLFGG